MAADHHAAVAPPRVTRRRFVRAALAGVVAVPVLDAVALEPRWLDVTEHDVPVAGLPSELRGYTIAQLTDVHLAAPEAVHRAVVRAVAARRPDLVVLTGDVIDAADALPALGAWCAELAAPGRVLLATLGNWEHWGRVPLDALAATYARAGARLLGNEHVALPRGLLVCATDDGCTESADPVVAFRDLPARAGARLLLTHAPALLDQLGRDAPRFDLALAGHTHGGQVRPVGGAVWLPPGSGRFTAGRYTTAVGPAYVSRGIGTSIAPARWLCRPEMPVFRLMPA